MQAIVWALDSLMRLQILPHGASKGAGVARMLKNVGASADGLMALGDGENDVQMFEVRSRPLVTHDGCIRGPLQEEGGGGGGGADGRGSVL